MAMWVECAVNYTRQPLFSPALVPLRQNATSGLLLLWIVRVFLNHRSERFHWDCADLVMTLYRRTAIAMCLAVKMPTITDI